MVAVGATIAAVQNVDELKEPLVKSMTKYDPNSSNSSNLDITRAWDDVQREVSIKYHIINSLVNYSTPRFTLLMWGHIKKRGKRKPRKSRLLTVVCKKVHKIGSVWCKMALGEVGVSH